MNAPDPKTEAMADQQPVEQPVEQIVADLQERIKAMAKKAIPAEARKAEEEDRRFRHAKQLWAESGVPLRIHRHVLAEHEATPVGEAWAAALEHLETALQSPNGATIICGGRPGQGRSVMAAQTIYRRAYVLGAPSLYYTTTELGAELRDAERRGNLSDLLTKLANHDYLVMDDFVEQNQLSYETRYFNDLIARRHNDVRRTLIICDTGQGQNDQWFYWTPQQRKQSQEELKDSALPGIIKICGQALVQRATEAGCILVPHWPTFTQQRVWIAKQNQKTA